MGIRGLIKASVLLRTLLLATACTGSSGAPLSQDDHPVSSKPGASSAAPKSTVASGPGSVYTPETSSAGSGGTDWTLMTPAPPQQPQSILWGVAAVDGTHAWAVGSEFTDRKASAPLIERWDGTSWTRETIQGLTHPESAALRLVAADAADDMWAADNGAWYDFQGPVLFHWDGKAWHTVKVIGQPKTTQFLTLVCGKSSNDLWAIGAQVGVGGTLDRELGRVSARYVVRRNGVASGSASRWDADTRRRCLRGVRRHHGRDGESHRRHKRSGAAQRAGPRLRPRQP